MNFRTNTKRSGRRRGLGIDLTPLVDVVFLLLIFFLITSTFVRERNPSIQIDVPHAQTSVESEQDFEKTVHVAKDGSLYLDKKPIESLEALAQELRGVAETGFQSVLLIRADEKAEHGVVVQIMDMAKAAGLNRFGIVTQSGE